MEEQTPYKVSSSLLPQTNSKLWFLLYVNSAPNVKTGKTYQLSNIINCQNLTTAKTYQLYSYKYGITK